MIVKSNRIRMRKSDAAFGVINALLLTLLILFFVYPFYNCLVLSFNDGQDALKPGLYFWPRVPTLENYAAAVRVEGFAFAALISATRTILGTFLCVIISAMFAYAVSKNELRTRKLYLLIATITMFFSGGMIPTFLLIKSIGLYNHYLVYIIPWMFNTFYSIIFVSAFREMPAALEESAMLDGAGYFTTFFRIVLPMSLPTIAAISIFTAVAQWNHWMDTMLYTDHTSLNTLSYLFAKNLFQQQHAEVITQTMSGEAAVIAQAVRGVSSTSIMLASMVIASAPIMIIYPFFQKYFVKGVMIGAIK